MCHFVSTSWPSTSVSQFCSFAALIVAAHQSSLPVSDIPSIFAFMAEKNASSARFRPKAAIRHCAKIKRILLDAESHIIAIS